MQTETIIEKEELNFDNYKFRASSIGKLMTGSRTKDPLGETAKAKLLEIYVKEKYGREKETINKYIEKGLAVEEDSITLYSRYKKKFYKKNEERLSNEFLSGTPDLFEGDSINEATLIIDIKSSWDIFTFYNVMHKPINHEYLYQLQSYMALTGAKESRLVYCLVSTPEPLILDEMNRLKWKMGVADPSTNEVYQKACEYLDASLRFEDIPISERIIDFIIKRDDVMIDSIYERVKLCRDFLNSLKK